MCEWIACENDDTPDTHNSTAMFTEVWGEVSRFLEIMNKISSQSTEVCLQEIRLHFVFRNNTITKKTNTAS